MEGLEQQDLHTFEVRLSYIVWVYPRVHILRLCQKKGGGQTTYSQAQWDITVIPVFGRRQRQEMGS